MVMQLGVVSKTGNESGKSTACFQLHTGLRVTSLTPEGSMFLGHFGVALAAKKLTPNTRLGTLIFAAQFLDFLWPIFLVLGLEKVAVVPGITAVTPLDFTSGSATSCGIARPRPLSYWAFWS
jgi:hypothetical protein